ncbi:MAG: 2-isopropylmalate synthase [Gemmataceae bacterium]
MPTTAIDPNRVLIFDTTLRDGEQSPGCSMNPGEKLEIAHALQQLGVDIIEAGFPIASPGDFESVREIARQVQGPVICGLARCNKADIERAWDAVRDAARPRIHIFISSSDIHIQHQLKSDRKSVLEKARVMVALAKSFCEDVEFSPMDATRSEREYLLEMLAAAVKEGATTLNIPDTVGYAMPQEYGELIALIRNQVPGAERTVISTHTHDDLGLAVPNALAGLQAGARQIECTINGIGERAGNTALEEIIMALRTRADYFNLTTGIDTRMLYPISRKLSNITGMQVQRNKAIVGQNAFAHESGIHQDGMLKDRSTYEIMRPQDVGIPQTELVLGKHSGRHALRQRIADLGYHLNEEQLNRVFDAFKILADRKKEVYDADIEALAENQISDVTQRLWTLHAFTCNAGTGTLPSAAVCLWRNDGTILRDAALGDGPVDAVFNTIVRITGVSVKLLDYRVRAVTYGTDAQGEAFVEAEAEGRKLRARAVSTDIIEASAQAYLEIINRVGMRQLKDRLKPHDNVPQEMVPVI